MLLSLR